MEPASDAESPLTEPASDALEWHSSFAHGSLIGPHCGGGIADDAELVGAAADEDGKGGGGVGGEGVGGDGGGERKGSIFTNEFARTPKHCRASYCTPAI